MKNTLRALQYFRPDAARIAFVFALLLFNIALGALKPWPLALIIDNLLQNKPLPHWLDFAAHWDKPTILAILSVSILALHLMQGALSAAQNYLAIKIGLRGLTRVRNELFNWLLRLSLRFHQSARAGDLIYRASWDTYSFQTLFQQGVITFVTAILSLILMAVIMAQINGVLTLVALALAPLLVLTIKFFSRKMSDRTAAAQQVDSRVTSMVQQSMAVLPLTQSYAREDDELKRFSQQNEIAQTARLSQHGWELMYWSGIAIVFGLGTAAVTWMGARQVASGQLSVGELIVFLAYLTQLYEPLNQLSHVGATVSGATAGTKRVFEILDTPEEVKDTVTTTERRALLGPTISSSPDIIFQNVSFSYNEKSPVLQNITFTLKPGESTAIIGPSGVGKTTLLHLLPRFFDPATGRIKLNGTDLREFPLKYLRTRVALVLQEPIILPATVAENIAYGKPDATAAEIEAAAKSASADLFIQKLPQKYDTIIGDGAARLSVGERQRINLARAFLKNAPILLLDEPTSALDAESEALVSASLRHLMRGRTTLMVAHRLSTISVMENVLILQEGRMAEYGPREKLKISGGYYTRLLAGGA